MKAFSTLVPISFAMLAAASPLGDRAVFQRHSGTPYHNARRYILQSRVDAPAACAALAFSNITTPPDLSNTTVPLSNSTTSSELSNVTIPLSNSTTSPNLTNTTVPLSNSTTSPDLTNLTVPLVNMTVSTYNSSIMTNNTASVNDSTLAANSTTTSRRWARHWRRIEQTDLIAVAQSWQDLCLVSGGDIFTNQPCVNLAGVDGINALLADADPCAQQDNADAMIAFARSTGVNNTDELIANAIAYRQHPRSAMNILGVVPSTVYCQKAPQSPELIKLINIQLDGVDPGLFGSPNIPLMSFGAPGTCPFGQDPDVTTCTCVDATNTTDTTGIAGISAVDASATSTSVADISASSSTGSTTSSGSATNIITTGIASSEVASAPTSISTIPSPSSAPSQNAATTPLSVSSRVASSPATATTAKSNGPNFQPGDISGDVNDIDG